MATELDRRDVLGWFIKEIEDHAAKMGVAPRVLCYKAVGSYRFMDRLYEGKAPRIDSIQIILDYIDDA